MDIYEAEPIGRTRFLLGEGPCYQAETGVLSWVDIKGATLWHMDVRGETRSLQTGQYLSAAIPTDHGRYVLMMTTGAYLANDQGLVRKLGKPNDLTIFQRFNDAKCDNQGRLFAGTMPLFDIPREKDAGLYAMSPGGIFSPVMTHINVSNGMAWTRTGERMYFADTGIKTIYAFDYDIKTGRATHYQIAFEMEDFPDGMTIDEEGMLWIALWGGAAVVRVNPQNGRTIGRVSVPARNVTSCCFGGQSHNILYITTSCETEPFNPMAGRLYRASLPMSGAPTAVFKEAK